MTMERSQRAGAHLDLVNLSWLSEKIVQVVWLHQSIGSVLHLVHSRELISASGAVTLHNVFKQY